jgi:tetratricopeptide (TPR) repeat protein
MKAFLSHSSRDRAVVERVADQLGLANVELDAHTFDHGLINAQAIQDALRRSALFVLFLSRASLDSGAVRFETMLATELVSRGLVERFLVVCLDEEAFAAASDYWKIFNFVRKVSSDQSIARLIQHNLLLLRSRAQGINQPFVGRAKEINDLKEKLIDPLRTRVRGIYVSGFSGIGRRTFSRRLFKDVYPSVISVFPEIVVNELDGYEELYRKFNEKLSPMSTLSAWRTRIAAFAAEDDAGKARLIAQLLERLIEAREAVFVADHGGLLDDEGKFQPPIQNIVAATKEQRRPFIIFIADRMMPYRLHSSAEGVVFSRLPPLSPDETKQLIALMLRDADVSYSADELNQLMGLADGHPFNVSFLVEAVKHYGISVVLGDPSEIIQWKRRRASDFLSKIEFSATQRTILSALKTFTSLDFELLSKLADTEIAEASSAITKLIDFHIIETDGGSFSVSSPLQIAVERDRRFELSGHERRKILKTVSEELTTKTEADTISVSMVDAAIIAGLESGGEVPAIFDALLLPSHLVLLARRRYDQGQFEECISLTVTALDGANRLSPAGKIEACRLLCLAAARRNDQKDFEKGIKILRSSANDQWARSNLNFLMGFNARMRGHLPDAEQLLRKAYEDSPGNFSAAHEIASICLIRGNIGDAEMFARKAFEVAPDNAYILDILLRILMARGTNRANIKQDQEVAQLFERLRLVGEEEGRSFYTTRRAEYELKFGNIDDACKLIDGAVAKTPGIFNVHALRAQIYLDRGNKTIALDEVRTMRNMVFKGNGAEQLTNLRPFLEVESSYYAASGDYEKAKEAYRRPGVFTSAEIDTAIKRIEVEQAYKRVR